jgi:hypothetical protein
MHNSSEKPSKNVTALMDCRRGCAGRPEGNPHCRQRREDARTGQPDHLTGEGPKREILQQLAE